jgi:hypothetical protein
MAELRMLISLLLTMVTIEPDAKSRSRGEFDQSRIGFGVFQARGDFDVILKLRS